MYVYVYKNSCVCMFNNVGANCDGLIKCISITYFITGNHFASEDHFPFIII